jgi:hypothetical protein
MLRGLPHLVKYMPEAKDARRLIPDPESELDFESISKVYPLPDAQSAGFEMKPAFQNASASTIGDIGFQQQLQGETNNNWTSIGTAGVTGIPPTQIDPHESMLQQRYMPPLLHDAGVSGMLPTQINPLEPMLQQRYIPPMLPGASGLESSQSCDAMRTNDVDAAAFHRETELRAQERQNMALLIELATRRQQFDDREQQANPGNADFSSLVGNMWNYNNNNNKNSNNF